MRVAFDLRRRPECSPAVALLYPARDFAGVLGICARLGLDPSDRVYDVSGGFLLRLDEPTRRALPGVVRLRGLTDNLFLPVDAELVPALLDDEAEGLTHARGLIFLPGGRALEFDPNAPLDASALLVGSARPRRGWRPLPERPPWADRIEEIDFASPDESPDSVLDAGAGEIGTEIPRPEAVGPSATLLGSVTLDAGRGLAWLGQTMGLSGLARLGSSLIDHALNLVPRLSEAVLGRQEAALRALLREFREGDIERALRRALPIGEPGGPRGGFADTGDQLPTHKTAYELSDLLSGTGRGPTSFWYGGPDVMAELVREYRRAAMRAVQAGDFRRAAFIYGKLLRDYRAAAHALLRGGMHHDAAVLLLAKLDDRRGAALAFEAAGESDRAVGLFRALGNHVAAGDLLRRIGEEDQALAEYHRAADLLVGTGGGYRAAGDLILSKVGERDLARAYFREGWGRRPERNAVSCALRLLRLDLESGDLAAPRRLLDEADTFFAQQGDLVLIGRFYNELVALADEELVTDASARDELRDRALLGLTSELRTRARSGAYAPELVALLSRRPDAWSATLVSDADYAISAATRVPLPAPPIEINDPTVRRLRVGRGVVTAFCTAPGSGEIFLGFEGGEVLVARPERSEVTRVADYGLAVSAMAASHDGESLVVLRSNEVGRSVLSTFKRDPGGSYRALLGTILEVGMIVNPGLTPILPRAGGARVGLWDGRELHILAVASLTWEHSLIPAAETLSPQILLLPWPAPHDEERFAALAYDGRAWTLFDAEGDVILNTRLNWRPNLPAPIRLKSAPVSWMSGVPDHLELSGLGGYGTLHWAAFHHDECRLDLVATCVATEEDGGYLAATIVHPRLVAVVTRTRIDWLRGGPGKFTFRASTPIALPSAVACAVSPRTGELIVICGDGLIVRVPIPF